MKNNTEEFDEYVTESYEDAGNQEIEHKWKHISNTAGTFIFIPCFVLARFLGLNNTNAIFVCFIPSILVRMLANNGCKNEQNGLPPTFFQQCIYQAGLVPANILRHPVKGWQSLMHKLRNADAEGKPQAAIAVFIAACTLLFEAVAAVMLLPIAVVLFVLLTYRPIGTRAHENLFFDYYGRFPDSQDELDQWVMDYNVKI